MFSYFIRNFNYNCITITIYICSLCKKKINNELSLNNIELENRTQSYTSAVDLEGATINGDFKYDNSNSIDNNILKLNDHIAKLKDIRYENDIQIHHENADIINPEADKLCSWIQIITACFSSFAHGSNDVANAIAPLATIYHIYKYDSITTKTDVPIWILLIGAIGIVIGLSTWGYKIINRMGNEITKISPSRGFIIELSAALTVIIASRAELPVSTTHCQVGSIVGCGLVGGRKNIKWKLLKNIVFSWLITLPITGILSATLFKNC
jgi:sodium-dependent phosphate transporter